MQHWTIKVALGVLTLALVACGGSAPAPAGKANEAELSVETLPSRPEIAVIPKGLAHQFWLTVKQGAEAGGK